MDDLNKMLMTFASYNAGPGRIRQLRREAEKQGLDPNVWIGNVEQRGVGADRPRDRHVRQQHLQVLHRLQAGRRESGTTQCGEGAGREETVDRRPHDPRISVTNLPRVCALALAVCGVLGTPARAFAQTDKWEVDVAPLYFWVATTSGNIAINGTRNIPVYMDFADAKSNLAGAFSFHGEARKGPVGRPRRHQLHPSVDRRELHDADLQRADRRHAAAGPDHLQREGDLRGEARHEVPHRWRHPHLDDVADRALHRSGRRTAGRHRHQQDRGGRRRRLHLPAQARRQGGAAHAGRHRRRVGVHLERAGRRRVPHQALDRAGGGLQRAPHRHRQRAHERERAGQRRAVRRDAVRSRHSR